MNRTRSVWLSMALLCAALLAGCGSSATTTTSSTPAATQPASTATSTSTSAATTPSTTAPTTRTRTSSQTAKSPKSTAATKRLALAVCESTSARAGLRGKMKTRIDEICHAYEHGDEAKAREVARNACLEAIDAMPGSSSVKQRARASCEAKK